MTGVGIAAKFVYDDGVGNGTWHDADKSNPSSVGDPDGWLCWAAAASNALAWTGWYGLQADGVTAISNADDIFDHFIDSWPNSTGNVMYGYDWWFDNVDNDPNDNPTGNAGFYASEGLIPGVYGGYWNQNKPTLAAISGYIDDDRAMEIQVDVGYLHSLTVWGMDEIAEELYFTDSDDGVDQLKSLGYRLGGDGFLYLEDYTNVYTTATDARIAQLIRLNLNDDGYTPILFGDDPGDDPTGVPEPATMFLLVSGLFGVACFSRKTKRI